MEWLEGILEWLEGIWGVIGTGFAIFASVNLLFFKSDDFFSREFKDDISLRLLCIDPPAIRSSWPTFFIGLFDGIFQKRQKRDKKPVATWRLYVSCRTFLMSIAASLVAFAVVVSIGITVGPLSNDVDWSDPMRSYIPIIAALVFNAIPDYISLLETRYLLR